MALLYNNQRNKAAVGGLFIWIHILLDFDTCIGWFLDSRVGTVHESRQR